MVSSCGSSSTDRLNDRENSMRIADSIAKSEDFVGEESAKEIKVENALPFFEVEGPVKALKYLNGPYAHLGYILFDKGKLIGVENPYGNLRFEGSEYSPILVCHNNWDKYNEYLSIKLSNDRLNEVHYSRADGIDIWATNGSPYKMNFTKSPSGVGSENVVDNPGKYVSLINFYDESGYYNGRGPEVSRLASGKESVRLMLKSQKDDVDHRGNWLTKRLKFSRSHYPYDSEIKREIYYTHSDNERVDELIAAYKHPVTQIQQKQIEHIIDSICKKNYWIDEGLFNSMVADIKNSIEFFNLKESSELPSKHMQIREIISDVTGRCNYVRLKFENDSEDLREFLLCLQSNNSRWQIKNIGMVSDSATLPSDYDWALPLLSDFRVNGKLLWKTL